MYKIAVIGGRDTIMCFKALGLDVFAADKPEEAKKILREITGAENSYAIIYISENLAVGLKKEIEKYKDSPMPAIILIPGREGSLGIGNEALQSAVERAVGIDIL